MTITIPGFTIQDVLYTLRNVQVLRAKRNSDQMPVFLKIVFENPNQQNVEPCHSQSKTSSLLNMEGELLSRIKSPYVLGLHEISTYQKQTMLVLENFQAETLSELMEARKIDLKSVLVIAVSIAKGLDNLHSQKITHRSINPNNIFINLAKSEVKIGGFNYATSLFKEIQRIENPHLFEYQLPYFSPEQTGWMNRKIDYRTDFYSLGIILYELLTHRHPFPTQDLTELIQNHINKVPLSPIEIDSNHPESLSLIIMKCLEKKAENRYQSAKGIIGDLQNCLDQLNTTGFIDTFQIGLNDKINQFILPEKIFGREQESEKIFSAFERSCEGQMELSLLTGLNGIGKNSIVKQLLPKIIAKRGHFAEGIWEGKKCRLPYSGWIQIIQQLLKQFLPYNKSSRNKWRDHFLKNLGHDGELLLNIIPEYSDFFGEQPPLHDVDPTQAEKRFFIVFSQFLNAFLRKDHPLVISLQNIHWMDNASLKLLEWIINDLSLKYTYFICSYNPDEIQSNHSLLNIINNAEENGVLINHIKVSPLNSKSIQEWLYDIFGKSNQDSAFAELLYLKSKGNPFYIKQSLLYLNEQNVFKLSTDEKQWTYDFKEIKQHLEKEDAHHIVQKRLKNLPKATYDTLVIASIFGKYVNLATLAYLKQVSLTEIAEILWPALELEILLPYDEHIAFKGATLDENDKEICLNTLIFLELNVQNVLFKSLSESALHKELIKIGTYLINLSDPTKLSPYFISGAHFLACADHESINALNRIELVEIFLKAGNLSKIIAAYDTALFFYQKGLSMLPEGYWETSYSLAFTLHENIILSALMSGKEELGEFTWLEAVKKAKTNIEKGKLSYLKILIYSYRNQDKQALSSTVEILKLWNISLKLPLTSFALKMEHLRVKLYFWLQKIRKEPFKLHSSSSDKALALALLFYSMQSFAPHFGKETAFWFILKWIGFTINQGVTEPSSIAYVSYGILLTSTQIEEYQNGFRFGQIGMEIANKFLNSPYSNKAQALYYIFLNKWNDHIRNSIPYFKEISKKCLEDGDSKTAADTLVAEVFLHFIEGDPIDSFYPKIQKYINHAAKYQEGAAIIQLSILSETCLAIKAETQDPCQPSPVNIDELLRHYNSPESNQAEYFVTKALKTYLLCLSDHYVEAMECSENLNMNEGPFLNVSSVLWDFYAFYSALALTAVCTMNIQKEKCLTKLEHYLESFKKRSEVAPQNYRHYYLILAAEIAKLKGQNQLCSDLFESAIAAAKENKFLHDEALAYELAARFYLSQDKKRVAAFYIQESYQAYDKWGGVSKIKQLNEKYAQLLSINFIPEGEGFAQNISTKLSSSITLSPVTTVATGITSTSSSTLTALSSSDEFDVTSLIQASQAISSEIVLDKLLAKLMQIVMVNAGADRAFLMLTQNDQQVVQAEIFLGQENATLLKSVSLEAKKDEMCIPVVRYVERSLKVLLLNEASKEGNYVNDPYIKSTKTQSILCMPLLHQEKLVGILYLENRVSKGAFTPERMSVLTLLSSQIATSIENALFYANLEEKVEQRTQQLRRIQNQLVQQEKMASLGLLTVGIAQEIKTPLTSVINFSDSSVPLLSEVEKYFENHRDEYNNEELGVAFEAITSLKSNVNTVNEQGKRADNIVKKMLEHSSGKTIEMKSIDLNAFLDQAIQSTYAALQVKDPTMVVHFEKEYDPSIENLDVIEVDFLRALTNLITNAYDSLALKKIKMAKSSGKESYVPTLTVKTKHLGDEYEIRIIDNGMGIPHSSIEKIFTPFFTTKSTGQGTGMGLSLSHHIIAQQHSGSLNFKTKEGEFAEFILTLPIKGKVSG